MAGVRGNIQESNCEMKARVHRHVVVVLKTFIDVNVHVLQSIKINLFSISSSVENRVSEEGA